MAVDPHAVVVYVMNALISHSGEALGFGKSLKLKFSTKCTPHHLAA